MTWVLRPGVSFCRPGDRTIFLDVNRDRYFCLRPDAELALRQLERRGDRALPDMAPLQGAIRDGLLIDLLDAPPPAPCAPPVDPVRSVYRSDLASPIWAILGMAVRLTDARLALRSRPLHTVLAKLDRRGIALERDANDVESELIKIAAALYRCGGLITPLDRCLPRSLAVAHRMLDRKVRPSLVLGVKLGPFAAHAWVQHDDVLVNDTIDYVRCFTPILVV